MNGWRSRLGAWNGRRRSIGFVPADFDTDEPITLDHLPAIEARMREIISGGEPFGELGRPERPAATHRAPLGAHERFIGFLIEHYAGAFLPGLAPVQVAVIPVGESGLRSRPASELDRTRIPGRGGTRGRHPGGRCSRHGGEQGSVRAVVGDREAQTDSVSVRARGGRQLGTMPGAEFIDRLGRAVTAKSTAPDLLV